MAAPKRCCSCGPPTSVKTIVSALIGHDHAAPPELPAPAVSGPRRERRNGNAPIARLPPSESQDAFAGGVRIQARPTLHGSLVADHLKEPDHSCIIGSSDGVPFGAYPPHVELAAARGHEILNIQPVLGACGEQLEQYEPLRRS